MTLSDVELAVCADVDEGAAHQAVRDYGYARSYLDYDEMLSREELDGVVVSLPHYLLKDATVAAVRAGRDVFVEKPVAMNRAQAVEIREAASQAGVSVMAGYCLRYAWGRRKMKSLIDSGAVGEIAHVCAGKAWHELSGWPADPEKGGGMLHWLGVHVTDQVLWMAGSEPERVYSEVKWHPQTGADQNSTYTVRFKNGVIADIVCSQSVGVIIDFIEVLGTAGRVRAEWPTDIVYVQSEAVPDYGQPTTMRPFMASIAEMYERMLREWVDSLSEGRDPPIGIEAGVNVLSVIDAVHESGRTGKPVLLG